MTIQLVLKWKSADGKQCWTVEEYTPDQASNAITYHKAQGYKVTPIEVNNKRMKLWKTQA